MAYPSPGIPWMNGTVIVNGDLGSRGVCEAMGLNKAQTDTLSTPELKRIQVSAP